MAMLSASTSRSYGLVAQNSQRLRRAQTLGSRLSCRRMNALPDQGEEISEAMKADLERLRAKSGASSSAGPSSQTQASQAEAGGPFTGAKDALDKLLIADFFLVLFILAWLAAGVAQNAVAGSSPLLDAWYPLWPLLWQPALGVLMAGALVSGGIGWLNEQAAKREQQ